MPVRRRSQSELPNAPLELLHPLMLPGADIPGSEIVGEIGGGDGATLLELLWAVLTWSAHPENAPVVEPATLERAEYMLLSRGPDAFASPAGLLAGYMARPDQATQRDVSWACVCISDWASGRGARCTALHFAQAAALAWPRHPRYAWLVGRLLRAHGRVREAEVWFRRAHRVAIWTDDWEAQAHALNSLGLLRTQVGRFWSAERLHKRAIRIASRHGLRSMEATAVHNLFTVYAEQYDFERAEQTASEAFHLYGKSHPHLPSFAHDVAQFWNRKGYFWRALPVFSALAYHFTEPEILIRVHAGRARASALAGDGRAFSEASRDVIHLSPTVADQNVVTAAYFESGIGAVILGRWRTARELLSEASSRASLCGASDVLIRADQMLESVEQQVIPPDLLSTKRSQDQPCEAEDFAEELARSLLEPGTEERGATTPRLSVPSPPSTTDKDPATVFRGRRVGR